MPHISGWETTEKLVEMHKRGQINELPTIIAHTAYTDEMSINRCKTAGMTDIISKPPSKEELRRIKEKYLE